MIFIFTGNDSRLHRPNPWEYLINKKYHLVWCNIFKAASTSWMYNFNLLAGYSPQFLKKTNMVPLSLARKKYPRPSALQVNTENFYNLIKFYVCCKKEPFLSKAIIFNSDNLSFIFCFRKSPTFYSMNIFLCATKFYDFIV
jgi:hypothetical protein